MSSQYYRGAIWTNHALDQLLRRGLPQDLVWQTWNKPEKSLTGRNPGTMEYQKNFGNSRVTVIAKQNEKNECIIISNWVDPPLPGSIDVIKNEQHKQYRKSSFWGKFFLTIKQQLGL